MHNVVNEVYIIYAPSVLSCVLVLLDCALEMDILVAFSSSSFLLSISLHSKVHIQIKKAGLSSAFYTYLTFQVLSHQTRPVLATSLSLSFRYTLVSAFLERRRYRLLRNGPANIQPSPERASF